MLLKITTNKINARELSFLLHKHPDRLQTVELPVGKAHVFYPKADEQECSVCLLLDINPIDLVRNNKGANQDFALAHYVNDRPYVASSYMSVAIAKAFKTAMNGTCKQKPELVDEIFPFEVKIAVLPARKGGEMLIKKLFEPLGYSTNLMRHQLDAKFTDWGDSRYFTVQLSGKQKLKDLLTHLYVLIPVLDSQKHYWVSQSEVEKLLSKGKGWLESHPEKEQITRRYLKGLGGLTRNALERLQEVDENSQNEEGEVNVTKQRLHDLRLELAMEELKESGAKRVVDLGCGDGKLLRLLMKEKQFTNILGMDVSYRELEKAAERLHYREMPPMQRERLELIQGALTYRDKRLQGFDAAAIIEVIEHLDLDRLKAFERVVFEFSKPKTIILSTPNREYNELFDKMEEGQFRHQDHRFEWTRQEFSEWVESICQKYGYQAIVKSIGEESQGIGAPSQMAVFKLSEL